MECKRATLNWGVYGNCLECNEPLYHNGKFCDHSCSAKMYNRNRLNVRIAEGKIPNCLVCNTAIVEYSKRGNGKYCSRACNIQAKKLAKDLQIEQGLVKTPARIKQYIYETRGRHCAICLITEWCGQPVPMILDHISGNSDDNSLENLRVVCPNCDAQLPTFKSKNKGNGRARRRERYQQGKSY